MSPPRLPLGGCAPPGFVPAYAAYPQAANVSQSLAFDNGSARQSGAVFPVSSPHQSSRLANVYSNAGTMMHASFAASPGSHGLEHMMASASLGTPPAPQAHAAPPFSEGVCGSAGPAASQQPPQHWQAQARPQVAQHFWHASGGPAPRYSHPGPALQYTHSEPAGSHLPSITAQRSASDRLSPRSAVESSGHTPRTAPVAATRPQGARSGGSTLRGTGNNNTNNSQSTSSCQHLGKNPACGYPGVPLTPAQTLIRYAGVHALTEYEQSEVLNYPHVYYIGAGANKHRARPKHRMHPLDV
jgi:hypothetical protein